MGDAKADDEQVAGGVWGLVTTVTPQSSDEDGVRGRTCTEMYYDVPRRTGLRGIPQTSRN